MLKAIREKLSEFKKLSDEEENKSVPKVSKNKIRLTQIDEEINDLLSKVGSANAILMKYINDKVNLLQSSRFGEALRGLQDRLDSRNFYAFNPSFDQAAAPQGPGGCMRQGNA